MFFAITTLILILGLSLSRAVVTRFGHSRGFWGQLFLQCLSGKASLASRLGTTFGALLVISAGILTLECGLFALTAERTTGTIERQIERSDDDGRVLYAPEFSFVDVQGRKHTTQSSLYAPLDEYEIGEHVPVLYSRFWFGRSAIDAYNQVWGLTTVLAILGSILLSAGSVRLYWPEISAHYQNAPAPIGRQQKLSRHLFRLAGNFFAMPGTLRFGTFACMALACLLPFIILTAPDGVEDELLEMAALAGVALILAGGLLCRSRWVRPVTVLSSLVIFYNAFADRFWLTALIGFIAQVVMPVGYLYFNPTAKVYFNREKPTFNERERSSFEFSFNDSGGKDVTG